MFYFLLALLASCVSYHPIIDYPSATHYLEPASSTIRYTDVKAMTYGSCAIDTTGSIRCWGDSDFIANVPEGQFTQLTRTTCALSADGHMQCWGRMQSHLPEDRTYSFVAASSNYTCGIDANTAELVCSYYETDNFNRYTMPDPPAGQFRMVDVGLYNACAITTDSVAICWGKNVNPAYSEAEGVLDVAVADNIEGLAICTAWQDGMVSCLLPDYEGPQQIGFPPLLDIDVAIDGGEYERSHQIAVKFCGVSTTGSVYCVGWEGLATYGGPPFVSVSVASRHVCALQSTGTIVCGGTDLQERVTGASIGMEAYVKASQE